MEGFRIFLRTVPGCLGAATQYEGLNNTQLGENYNPGCVVMQYIGVIACTPIK